MCSSGIPLRQHTGITFGLSHIYIQRSVTRPFEDTFLKYHRAAPSFVPFRRILHIRIGKFLSSFLAHPPPLPTFGPPFPEVFHTPRKY
ncbi:hypothetical protein CDAR_574101 [Caerostris darwini]|uniref:Uncharacterized protein n=1 Tax=Caerostris darwini TaxID=1538125 RepID=A0AAV4T550_9ARAC|nr:hypothetical protein CDAR_574101 [Caerostris darwini]